jgi:hypothetical protein
VRFLYLLSICIHLWTPSYMANPPSSLSPVRQVWVILIPGWTMDDLHTMSQMDKWFLHSRVGGINGKTGSKKDTLPPAYASLGAGSRAVAPDDAGFFYADEQMPLLGGFSSVRVDQAYRQRTGWTAPPKGIVYPKVMEYIRENEKSSYRITPGALGESLRRHGRGVYVLGNLDQGDLPIRLAPFLAMDARGAVPAGEIGRTVFKRDVTRPYGVKTDYAQLEKRLIEWKKPGMAVVELGDLYRLEQLAEEMTPEQVQSIRQRVLTEIRQFLKDVQQKTGSDRLLFVLSPGPTKTQTKLEFLLPAVLYRPGQEPGLLTSATTRRQGIISNMDVAPTILQALRVPSDSSMLGQPVTSVSGGLDDFWSSMYQVQYYSALRPSVLYLYILLQLAGLLLALYMLVKRRRGTEKWIQMLMIALMLVPFLFLIIPGSWTPPFWVTGGLLLAVGIGLSWWLLRLPTLPLLFWIGVISSVPLIADVIRGSLWVQHSFLGYDPVKGARYYGIGNEYMGVVIGAVLLACGAWIEWKQPKRGWQLRMGMGLLFAGLVFFFAAPFWGTNAGGALAATVAFGVAYVRFFRLGYSSSWLVWGLLIGAGILVLIFVNVWLAPEQPSHIGRAMGLAEAGKVQEIGLILKRKVEMNLKLIRLSLWGKTFLVSLGVMAVLAYRPIQGIQRVRSRYPQLYHAFYAAWIGALTALLFNDSGIVAAATTMLYVVIPLLFVGLREWLSPSGEGSKAISV